MQKFKKISVDLRFLKVILLSNLSYVTFQSGIESQSLDRAFD